MKARTATVGDLESVFHDLSRRMAIEYIAAGKDTKAAYDNLMMNLREGRAHALLQGGKVVAIIAWHEVDGATDTLFAAKEEFFNRNTVRFCKQHIRQIQALAGDLPVHSRSWLDGVVTLSFSGRKGQELVDIQAKQAAIFHASKASRRW